MSKLAKLLVVVSSGVLLDVSSYKNSSPKMSKLDFFIWSLQNRNHYEYNRGIELPLYFETDVSSNLIFCIFLAR